MFSAIFARSPIQLLVLKHLILFALLTAATHTFAQDGRLPLDSKNNISYTDSGQPKLSKTELHQKVRAWVDKKFGNAENAITSDDTQAGIILITSYIPVIHSSYQYVRFDLGVQYKDNQYDARITTLDGVSAEHSPVRLNAKENDDITAKEQIVKTESNRKKRKEAELNLQAAKADNDGINTSLYNLLGDLKNYVMAE
ncbi:hypothetical protein Dfer_0111 [Dyadobacter fermentans DSM 18053]|uniref:DUF4468 domain-containing protein n=1 Tax=Dyadobacter fermentans (strain ATCC 700827 / DSM 18053 / CIP 107007 / KCTC 52180 / NS114) TaxID=471854 RepID=C6VVS6_DYAFD|nr:hypothetical protein Dfer_0111 [Dyadobacter fermentans DSM 18053]